jgi:hypothetical protein
MVYSGKTAKPILKLAYTEKRIHGGSAEDGSTLTLETWHSGTS